MGYQLMEFGFQQAFDKVPHHRLLLKLRSNGEGHKMVKTTSGGCCFGLATSGVPLGFVL